MPRSPRGKTNVSSDGTRTVVSKNPNGQGSVYYEEPKTPPGGRTSAGRWRATWTDHAGKRRRVSAPTRAEAEAKRDELAAATDRFRPSRSKFGPDTTIAELISWWLDSVARHRVKASTFDSYRKFGSYLADDIGDWRVIDAGPEAITEWQSRLLDRYAAYTVLNCRKVCRQAFDEAVKFGLIPNNPFNLVKAPRGVAKSNARALTPEDTKRLIRCAQDLRYGAVVTLLFCQGWRISEVLGLAWEDLDLDAGTAHIRRGATYSPSTGTVLGTTKTFGAQGEHYLAPSSMGTTYGAIGRSRTTSVIRSAPTGPATPTTVR